MQARPSHQTFRVAVLMACYNRVDLTIHALGGLYELLGKREGWEFGIFLVDDGSSDGTSSRVALEFPEVNVLRSEGNLYWNRGMRLAFEASRELADVDCYLLFNDDVEIIHESASACLDRYFDLIHARPAILVGGMISKQDGSVTYAGFNERSRWRVLSFSRSGVDGYDLACDTFNANFVLVPGAFFRSIDGLDPKFHHGLGDLDLGLVARNKGVASSVFEEPVGYCERGITLNERIVRASRRERFSLLFRYPHGMGPYLHFAWKHRPRYLIIFYFLATLLSRIRRWFL